MDDSIFRDYINEFMKNKVSTATIQHIFNKHLQVEASGWENVGIDPNDEDAKDRFCAEYALREGIIIDKDNVRLNKGLRYIAKLCLNRYAGYLYGIY